MAISLVTVTPDPAHELLLDAFYRGIYWDAFERQREPLDVWQRALRGELPYRQTIRLALDGGEVVAGIAYEHYPRSGCGLVTYMVVAPSARRGGLGKHLLGEAAAELYAGGAPAVFGEVDDPRRAHAEPTDAPRDFLGPGSPVLASLRAGGDPSPSVTAWRRLERNQRWGARVLGARYVQPALGPGLARDRDLVLIVLAGGAPLPTALDGSIPRGFVEELYEITEGGPPDEEISFPDRVPLVELAR